MKTSEFRVAPARTRRVVRNLQAALVAVLLLGGSSGCERGATPSAPQPRAAEEDPAGATELAPPEAETVEVRIEEAVAEDCFVLMEADPEYGPPPLQVSFAADIECTEGEGLVYAWDFGDGSPTSSEASPVHTYATTGDYIVTLKVTDSTGAFGTDELDIFVEEEPSGEG
jgi:hypothetical protein